MSTHPDDLVVADGFEPVRDLFLARSAEIDPGSAAFCARIDGREVVSLQHRAAPTTLFVMMSSTKGLLATACMMLADRGRLDVDAPVRAYWPEFTDDRVLVRHVLSHRAGLFAIPGYAAFMRSDGTGWDDKPRILEALASAVPENEPGTEAVYHGLTIGYIVDEIFVRVDGRTIGGFLRDEVCRPANLDVWIGLPDAEHHRVVDVIAPAPPTTEPALTYYNEQLDPSSVFGKILLADEQGALTTNIEKVMNSPERRRMELPFGNGIATASSLAALYDALPSLVSRKTLQAWTNDEMDMHHIPVVPLRWGLGFQLNSRPEENAAPSLGPGPRTFGHVGFGGQIGRHDPETGLSAAFLTSRLRTEPSLGASLIEAVYDCL